MTLREEPEGIYFLAFVEELPALKADGTTREEALLRLAENFDDPTCAPLEFKIEYVTLPADSNALVPPPGATRDELLERLLDEDQATKTTATTAAA